LEYLVINDSDFDFDAWSRLAKEDPAAFEAQRAKLIREVINQAPEEFRQRIEGLQWRIDMVRQQARTPMSACIQISRMMWDAVVGDNGLVENMERLADAGKPRQMQDAAILPFRRDPEEPSS
jgi:hypothetical protein